jgi:hypothetical protein
MITLANQRCMCTPAFTGKQAILQVREHACHKWQQERT